MLVLSRKEGQAIVIGDGIEVRVADIQGSRVRLAVSAPGNVRIVRSELLEDPVQTRREGEGDRSAAVPTSHCV